MDSSYFLSLIQRYWKEYLITGLFGGIPTPLGMLLRNSVYTIIFDRVGQNVRIHPKVQIFGTRLIQIGSNSQLFYGVYIKAKGCRNTVKLGECVTLDRFVTLITCDVEDGDIEIGDSTYIGAQVRLDGPGFIKIGRDCTIASYSTLVAGNHHFSDRSRPIREQGMSYKGITVEDDCWLGSGVRVLDGVTIGRGSVIGAGSVVTKDIPPYSIAVGVPAKVIGEREQGMPAELCASFIAA
jgi:acetyltransferase-like isoleucine patch superfamily enzyme